MAPFLEVGGQQVELVRKAVKNVHLSVHPPDGRVTLVVPTATRQDVARAYVASRLAWIRKRQEEFRTQRREPGRQFVTRESHQLWGKRYLLRVDEREAPPEVQLDHRRIVLGVRPGSTHAQRAAVMDRWHRGDPPIYSGRQKWSYAARANFIAGVMPPRAILGRSLLYVQSQRVPDSWTASIVSKTVCASQS